MSQALAVAGQFAAATIHETRGSLEAITNLNYLLQKNANDSDQTRHYSLLIDEQLALLAGITRQTLSFYHAGDSKEPTRIAPLAEAALRVHRHRLVDKEIRLLKNLPGDVMVEVNPGALLQVLSNLIANSVEAMPVKGTLRLRARSSREEVHIMVADDGSGIPASISRRVFEPFFTTKKEHGTGLGLAISKTIIEGHRGRIRSHSSTRTGRSGTAFRISLPLGKVGGNCAGIN